jgi:hypothetical protein
MPEDKSTIASIKNTCNRCHKQFQSKTHLTRHKNRKNPCKLQPNNDMKAFNDFIKLCNHPNFTLEIRKKVIDYLDYKLRIINESKLINKPEYKCDNCGTTFAHRQSHDRHIKLNRCDKK